MSDFQRRRVVRISEFGKPEVLVLENEPVPVRGPSEILVKVEAVGVNFADTMTRRGEYLRNQVLPHVPGMEAAGVVVESDAESTHPVGARVALFLEHGGSYTDLAVVPLAQATVVEGPHSSATIAGVFLQGVTGWYAVHRYGRVVPGETVLVTGAGGGLGGLTVQLAKDAGAVVIGAAASEAKRRHVLDIGCQHVVDPASPDWVDRVLDIFPRGIDVIIDGVGGELFDPLMRVLAKNGRFVVVGSATQAPAMLDVRRLLPRGQTVVGFIVRNVLDQDQAEPARALGEVLARIDAGIVKPSIDIRALSSVVEVHRDLEERRVTGKIVLDPSH
jgi:NADPH2:quinone reductase